MEKETPDEMEMAKKKNKEREEKEKTSQKQVILNNFICIKTYV